MPEYYRPPAGVLFPYAHIVSDAVPSHVRHLYSVPSIAKFKSDLGFLCREYRPLRLSELDQIPQFRNSRPSPRYFTLSFDDGMREVYDIIAPILHDKGIPAIFFLNSATIDNKQLMWRHKISLLIERSRQTPARIPPQFKVRSAQELAVKLRALRSIDQHILNDVARFYELDFDEYLRSEKPYLTSDQILELALKGFEFGAHSESHPYFNEMTTREQMEQVSNSVGFIRTLGISCRYFAFPFHDNGVSSSVFKHIAELGLVLSFGTSEARVDPISFSFQRFSLDGNNVDWSIQDLLKQLSAKSIVRRLCRTSVICRE